MTNAFDVAGDLWIDTKVDENRPDLPGMFGIATMVLDATGTMPGSAFAVQRFNLTAYIRSIAAMAPKPAYDIKLSLMDPVVDARNQDWD